MTMPGFDNILVLDKRCAHFLKDGSSGEHARKAMSWSLPWGLCLDGIRPEGMGVAVHNYALMQSIHDTYTEKLLWLDALAASLNRYIDKHRIDGDVNALRCLRWWRRHLFFYAPALR